MYQFGLRNSQSVVLSILTSCISFDDLCCKEKSKLYCKDNIILLNLLHFLSQTRTRDVGGGAETCVYVRER